MKEEDNLNFVNYLEISLKSLIKNEHQFLIGNVRLGSPSIELSLAQLSQSLLSYYLDKKI